MTPAVTSEYVKGLAGEIGFDRCGITEAEPIGRAVYLRTWLDSERPGSMEYLRRHFKQRADPATLLDGAASIIIVALLYHQRTPPTSGGEAGTKGRVAMYAWGEDYHEIVRAKLREFLDRLRSEVPEPFDAKVCVDTAPLLEREIAAVAGIGWIGKNTLVIDPKLGSYFCLGALVTTLSLEPDSPLPDR